MDFADDMTDETLLTGSTNVGNNRGCPTRLELPHQLTVMFCLERVTIKQRLSFTLGVDSKTGWSSLLA